MDESQTYLAVPNWTKYQPKLKDGRRSREWIRLDCNTQDDRAFSSLPDLAQLMIIRYWQYIGRTGKWLENSPEAFRMFARSSHVTTRMVAGWLQDATRMGLLVLSNQQNVDGFLTTGRDETGRNVTTENVPSEHSSPSRQKPSPPEQKPPVKEPDPVAFRGEILQVTEKVHRSLLEAFPSLDHVQQYRRADAWLVCNASRRKKNHGRFIQSWFGKAQERHDRINMHAGASGRPLTFGQALIRHNQEVARQYLENLEKEGEEGPERPVN